MRVGEEGKRREFEKSTNKKERNKEWQEQTGKERFGERNVATGCLESWRGPAGLGGGSAAGCSHPPARASRGRFQRASCWKGSLKGQWPRQGQHHHWETDRKKVPVSPAGRPEGSVVS